MPVDVEGFAPHPAEILTEALEYGRQLSLKLQRGELKLRDVERRDLYISVLVAAVNRALHELEKLEKRAKASPFDAFEKADDFPFEFYDRAVKWAAQVAADIQNGKRSGGDLTELEMHAFVLAGANNVLSDAVQRTRAAGPVYELPKAWRTLVAGGQQIGAQCEPDSNAAGYWRGFCVAINGMADDLERTLAGKLGK